MSARPSRRAAATRRAAIIESDDDDDLEVGDTTAIKQQVDSEDDFEPEPEPVAKSPRRQTGGRRKTAGSASTPRPSRARKSVVPTEPSEILDPDQSTATVIHNPEEEPVKKPAPRKRKSAAPRKASKELSPDVPSVSSQESLPTPKASASPEPSQLHATPLADITNQHLGDPKPVGDETVALVKPIKAMDTILERPMDIVLKSRTQMSIPVVEDTGPKARTVITYLVLNNFKSYAGRQEVGPFHASFSSVVGPNGSGKSNVIDSLLFVFGFRASKMRQGKISALIHNSAAYPDLDYCEVAVHFQEVMDLVGLQPCPSRKVN
jgi:structural maintenance of chromosome 4